jgi:hypothetical protein
MPLFQRSGRLGDAAYPLLSFVQIACARGSAARRAERTESIGNLRSLGCVVTAAGAVADTLAVVAS